jgi:GNAT superfamily N-acetyltransferase
MRVVENLSEAVKRNVLEWHKTPSGVAQYGLSWRAKQQHILCYADGQLVAKAGVLKHCFVMSDQTLWVGGVGSVITMPGARRRGHATATLEYAAAYLRDNLGVSYGLLFCAATLVPFYERIGWRLVPTPIIIDQPNGPMSCPLPSMYLQFDPLPWPGGIVTLESEPW